MQTHEAQRKLLNWKQISWIHPISEEVHTDLSNYILLISDNSSMALVYIAGNR